MKSAWIFKLACVICWVVAAPFATAKETITLSPIAKDMTPVLGALLRKAKGGELKIVFEKGVYTFLPDYAESRYSTITNHGNGLKKVIFPLENFKSVEIIGNGAELIFHGQVAPFQLYNNKKINISNLIIDWDIPFTFVSEVVAVNKKEGWREVKPYSGSHHWRLEKGQIKFPNVDGFSYEHLGSTLAWDPVHQRVAHGAWDTKSTPDRVERRENGVLRIYEKLKRYPAVGMITSSKGDRETQRYAPAIQVKNSKNVVMDGVIIHHALGMGFLFERTDGIQVVNSGVHLRKGSRRIISTTADATHFANCKGDILIENSRFENMLDDGTNVHGTYVAVDEIINAHTVRIQLMHFEQRGFEFAGKGDEIWFVHQPSVRRASVNTVKRVYAINERYTELTFDKPLPEQLRQGDLLENKTWNPTFTMRGTTIRDHRARNVVLKTPRKTVIENNHFSSMMSSILFRGETFFWYESGVVEDVVIRNNTFEYVAYSGAQHAVMYITPRLGKTFHQDELYDRNIRFENNTIKTFDHRIIWADRVDGLLIKNNTIVKTNDQPQLYPDAPLFEFVNSRHVVLENNHYSGEYKQAVKADKKSRETLSNDGSIQ